MPKRKKRAIDMTTEELAKAVFPPKLLKKLKEIAHGEVNRPNGNKSASKG